MVVRACPLQVGIFGFLRGHAVKRGPFANEAGTFGIRNMGLRPGHVVKRGPLAMKFVMLVVVSGQGHEGTSLKVIWGNGCARLSL